MANEPLIIKVDPDSELGRALDEIDETPVVLACNGVRFRVTRDEDDPWANDAPELVRDGRHRFAGMLGPEEGESLKELIYRGREEGTRSVERPRAISVMEPVEYVPLVMVRDHLDGFPVFACPDGYRIRSYRPGDERDWARIETLAGEFTDEGDALRRFEDHFGPSRRLLVGRSFFLEAPDGEAIGTATAWLGALGGEARGRVDWVGIVPEYQGRGLAKPLLSRVMARLAEEHANAYLTTQTTSWRAVNLYLTFGFAPHLARGEDPEGWRIVERLLGRRIV